LIDINVSIRESLQVYNQIDNVAEIFKTAEQGKLEISELLDISERWSTDTRMDELPKLYQTWIDHTSSPLMHVAYFNYANVIQINDNLAQAEALYRKALEHKSNFIQAHINLGSCLVKLDREDEAIKHWLSPPVMC